MLVAPMPSDESERLAALVRCNVLDTDTEASFDDIAELASALCGAPMALVSLVDRTRQWFKAKVGVDVSETPRDVAFCAHAIVDRKPLVVPDTLADARFADNPLVTGDPFIRFYAGIPLLLDDDGVAVGTLCILDRIPRELSSAQLDTLCRLAKRVSKELSLRHKLALQRASSTESELPTHAAERHASTSSRAALTAALSAESPELATELRSYTEDTRASTELVARPLAPLPVALGTVVAERYRVERVLGMGGMGVVTAARDLRALGAGAQEPGASPAGCAAPAAERVEAGLVAIKFMHLSALAQPHALRRFVREAQALIALEGAHVARVLDVGNLASGAPFLVMEYLDGEDLAARLRREGPLPEREAIALTLQATDAIVTAHALGILHRDLKPANLFEARQPDGSTLLKVLDFGISKLTHPLAAQSDTALTGVAVGLGSPHYMAPEQMIDAAAADERSDIWSLGVVLYELLAGAPPWQGENAVEVCAKVLTLPLPPIGTQRPQLRDPVVRVIERCLEKAPEDRYGSASELVHDLRSLL